MATRIDVSLDTNILLRTSFDETSSPSRATRACAELIRRGFFLGTTVANMAEFANVSTRPLEDNGYGLSVAQTQNRMRILESQLIVFSESLQSYDRWKHLVAKYEVRGKQVHDTRITAIMLQEDIRSVLTFNTADFTRFPEIVTLHPDEVLKTA
jgi:predicted nucleic acid-binding protein